MTVPAWPELEALFHDALARPPGGGQRALLRLVP